MRLHGVKNEIISIFERVKSGAEDLKKAIQIGGPIYFKATTEREFDVLE